MQSSVHSKPADVPTVLVDAAVLVLSPEVALVLPTVDEVVGAVEDAEADKDEEVKD